MRTIGISCNLNSLSIKRKLFHSDDLYEKPWSVVEYSGHCNLAVSKVA